MADGTALAILRLGVQGDGIAATDAGPIFVPGALPGETFVAEGANFTRIGLPSPSRRPEPLCPHVGACGGCTVQHMDDALYRTWKSGLLTAALAQFGITLEPAPLASVPTGSRRRAALGGGWQNGRFALGFNRRQTHDIERITACAVLAPAIVAALPALTELASRLCRPGTRVRVLVLAADNGLDVAIESESLPKRRDAVPFIPALARLAADAGVVRLALDGEPALQRANPQLTVSGAVVVPPPGAFVQAAREAEQMLAGLVITALAKARRTADLFAGLGTLTLAMATKAAVTAFDSDADLLTALGDAAARTAGLKPVTRIRRDLHRDPLSARELAAFDAVVLDPPRAGARAQAEALAKSKVRRVVMVSCNPATLARDLAVLIDGGYALEAVTPVDQFLFTAHLEAVAMLSRH